MPKKQTPLGQPERQYYVDVTLSADHLNGSGRLVGKVNERTVTLRELIADVEKEGTCLLRGSMLLYAAQTLEAAYLERIRRGYAVDVLGLGRLYHALDGTFAAGQDDSDSRPQVVPRFTPSRSVAEACGALRCRNLREGDTSPAIRAVRGFPHGENGEVLPGAFIEIAGEHLKVTGDGAGVFLVPEAGGGEIRIPPEKLHRNFPKSLAFLLPEGIVPGVYALEIRTRWSRNGRQKKNLCRGGKAGIAVAEKE